MLTLRPKWWQWPTVLSIDAPAVVLAWQLLVARVAGVPLRSVPQFVLGASVWLAYVADRWFEGWRLDPERIRTQRHHFYHTWRWPIAVVWTGVLGLDLTAAGRGLSGREFLAGLGLLVPVAAYLLSHQLIHRHHRGRVPKEICVAALLAGGVGVFVAAAPDPRPPWVAVLGLFALLALANCALISVWEHAVDQSHGQTSLARQFRRGVALSRLLPWLPIAWAIPLGLHAEGVGRIAVSCALGSGLLLVAIDLAESRLGRERARVLADVALLTPLVPLAASLWQ